MKLSKREKIMLSVLAIMAVGYGSFTYYIDPTLKEIDNLKQTAKIKSDQVKIIEDAKKLGSKLNEEEKKYLEIINEKSKNVYNTIEQDEIIIMLSRFIRESGVEVQNLNFSGNKDKDESLDESIDRLIKESEEKIVLGEEAMYRTEEVLGGMYDVFDGQEGELDAISPFLEDEMEVELNFSGTLPQVIDFLNKVNTYKKKMIVTNLNINAASLSEDVDRGIRLPQNGVTGSLNIRMSSFLNVFKTEVNEEVNQGSYGKTEMFESPQKKNNESVDNKGVKSNQGLSEDDIDMWITLRPESYILPTASISVGKVNGKSTEIYHDENSINKIEIKIKKEKGKYYTKYKTNSQSYPAKYQGWIPTKKRGENFDLLVFSTPRTGRGEDVSGCQISVYNATGEEIQIHIQNEDAKQPRANIVVEQGKAKINR